MRPLRLILISILLAAGQPVAAQTLEEANRLYDKKEYARARDVLEPLAQQGMTEAEFRLAQMYVEAVGIPRNTYRGIELYESAARKGHVGAQFFLANELAKGGLIRMDKPRAVALWRTAAKQKHGGAQYALCDALSAASSKDEDQLEAYAWCAASSGKSHKMAGEAARLGRSILGRLELQGAHVVLEAKLRAAQYTKAY